jgi:hypothetical protein
MKRRLLSYGAWLGVVMSTRLTAQVTPIPEPIFRAMVAPQIDLTASAPTPIVQISIPLKSGQMVRAFGRAEFFGNIATASGTNGGYNYAEASAECLDPSGGNAGHWAVGQNYEGPQKAPGPSYPLTGHLVISPSTLITANMTGTYTCELLASTDKPTMVVGEAYEGDSTTWLRVSAPIEPTDAQSWTTAKCTEGALPQSGGCPYLPPDPSKSASLQPYVDVLNTSVSNPPPPPGSALQDPSWLPPQHAAFVDVTDTMEVSVCGHQADSCPSNWQSGNYWSVVNTYVELVQLNAANGACQKADSPIQQTTINEAPHHYVIYHRLVAVPVYPSCGTNKFVVRLYAKSVSGSPVVVDGAQAIAFTSYQGKGQPVPNVGGLTQSAAASALSSAGYVINSVSGARNVAPLGSVTMQYPAAGVIELPGSGVDLTVSAGGVLVPNVVGLPEKNAVDSLAAAGLNANVSSKPGCLDKGIVNAESPTASTTVLPHSFITITVNSGTTTNGKPCQSD